LQIRPVGTNWRNARLKGGEILKRSKNPVINVGGSSVLVIFAVLSLVIFSVLSLVSARADRRMVLRQENTLLQRQKAEAAAEERLAEIDTALLPLKNTPVSQWEGREEALLTNLPVTIVREGEAVLLSFETSFEEAVTKVVLRLEDTWEGNIRSAIVQWKTNINAEEDDNGQLVEILD
jgi:type II secretory pathway pseudopilin PulG